MVRSHDRSPTVSWKEAIPAPGDPLPPDIEQFLAWLAIEKNRPSTTVRSYRTELAKFVGFVSQYRDITSPVAPTIDRSLLHQYQLELARLIPHPRSRAHALVALRQYLRYSHDEEWTAHEMSRQVTIPRYVSGDPHPVPTELVPQLLHALPRDNLRDERDRALLYFLFSTGCRISEACRVNRQDIREDGFRVLGKGGKYRTVFCTKDALEAVNEYLLHRGQDKSPALFINVSRSGTENHRAAHGNRLTPDGARHALRALKRRMGNTPERAALFDHLTSPHAARHTTATTLLEATGGDVRLVQEVLGHATLETLKVYTEITDRRKRAAYSQLEDYLDEVDHGKQ
ncbi:MAG: tyrosine-type recombinase/integrase [Candidatus Dormibacteria bacterium]